MTFYQSVCKNGDFVSSFFQRKGDAVKAANRHIEQSGGTHIVRVDEVFFPDASAVVVTSHEIALN